MRRAEGWVQRHGNSKAENAEEFREEEREGTLISTDRTLIGRDTDGGIFNACVAEVLKYPGAKVQRTRRRPKADNGSGVLEH
jgi:hypothetical protein